MKSGEMEEEHVRHLIDRLNLEPHIEGGWFRRTFQAEEGLDVDTPAGKRPLLSSIYYLLTSQSPVGHFHKNRSGIMHYFHEGDAIDYFLLYEDGRLEQHTLGRDLEQGQLYQLFVPGGVWKASHLSQGESGFGLISEAVAPGFDYADMQLGEAAMLSGLCVSKQDLIASLCRT